ncbi:TatD family hydrolase [Candidatus Babeliales bacterium]|nr:TatD family hydrolase [Candidatus Babeliales bacterium]
MFIDTHCHLNMIVKEQPDKFLDENHFLMISNVIKEAREKDVGKIITIGTSVIESINSVEIAKRFDEVFAAVGIHPCDCKEDWRSDFERIKDLVKEKKKNNIIAIGETGLDFFHRPFHKQRQFDAFRTHIDLAIEHDLPLVMHVRHAADEVLTILQEYTNIVNVRGVMHSFLQDKDFANTILKWGMYFGIGATITYPKNNDLRDLVSKLPLEKILLETDAPFLPPQQLRGKKNLPSYIPIFSKTVAELKNIDISLLEKVTTDNATRLFSLL